MTRDELITEIEAIVQRESDPERAAEEIDKLTDLAEPPPGVSLGQWRAYADESCFVIL